MVKIYFRLKPCDTMYLAFFQKSKAPQQTEPEQRPMESDLDEGEDADDTEKLDIKKYLIGLARDILIAIIVMAIIIGSLWGYTSNWPPMVVIESNSMMHDDDSSLGTIDTGDLVLVKRISRRSDITTYVQGVKTGYKTYGTYGDVIIFKKNGLDDTPVIHRAVVWVEYNASGFHYISNNGIQIKKEGSFDIPELGEKYYNIMELSIENYRPKHINLTIDFYKILKVFNNNGATPHSGFITKGDNNLIIDQDNLPDSKKHIVEPIKVDWIVGKAEGELPWFGLIKLYVGGQTDDPDKRPPPTSVRMLILSIALIIIIPIILDLSFSYLGKRRKKRKEEEADKKISEEMRLGPGHDLIRGGGPGKKGVKDTQGQPPSRDYRHPSQPPGKYLGQPKKNDGKGIGISDDGAQDNSGTKQSKFTSKEELLKKIK
jgi:signal peptidase